MLIMESHFLHSRFQSMESLSKLSRNVMEYLPSSPSPMPWSTDVTRWVVYRSSVEIPSTCSYMRQNFTWLDKTYAFMVWEGFKAQEWLTFPQTIWDHPHLHQRSSCSLMVIIIHSHQWSLCRNSIEMSWNVFQEDHHQCHDPPMPHVKKWVGPTLKFIQIVHVCIEIWHG